VGDWVILTEEKVKESLAKNKEGRYVKDYYLPQKIMAIRYQEFEQISTIYIFAPNRITTMEKGSFRLATEREIKNQKIKNIFIEKRKSK
jgi:hypothetical protein